MGCDAPIRAWWGRTFHESGKRRLVFRVQDAYGPTAQTSVDLPCGRCTGCRLERSRQWAVRCMHEASLYDDNVFVTLTFSDEGLQRRQEEWGTSPHSLDVEDLKRFVKRLLKATNKYSVRDSKGNIVEPGIRHFSCGEYGELNNRPHYHLCVFNHWFEDSKRWKTSSSGEMLYVSEQLQQLWPYGSCPVGAVTFKSAAYVARYAVKKVGTPKTCSRVLFDADGVVHQVAHEFGTQSKRPGIGALWVKKHGRHTRDQDFVVVNGRKCRPPKAYDQLNEREDPERMAQVKRARRQAMDPLHWAKEGSAERRRVKAEVRDDRTKRLRRDL